MREILFRGRRTIDGEWVCGGLISYEQYCCILSREQDMRPVDEPYLDHFTGCFDGYATPIIPETVGQYTGLTDKNGKKIFEGDILSAYFDEEYPENETRTVVVWHDIGFYLCYEGRIFDLFEAEDAACFEVVGNVHENPELMEASE